MASTVLALPAVVDLLGPSVQEKEQIFPVLQMVLHVLIEQLGFSNTKVEFRGSDSSKIKDLLEKNKVREDGEMKIVYETRAKDEDSQRVLSDELRDISKEKKVSESEASFVVKSGEILVVDKKRPHVTMSSFHRLDGKVKMLQAQVESLGIQVLPSDEALLAKTRSSDHGTPITDLWQSMNITKRMSGAEEGIDKLASLLETIAKEYADLKQLLDKMQEEIGHDVVDTIKEIKLAAEYAKKMRPRAELYEKALEKREKTLVKSSSSLTPPEMHTADAADVKSQGSGSDRSAAVSGVESTEHIQAEGEEKDLDVLSEATDISAMDDKEYEKEFEKFRMLPDRNEEAIKINNLTMDQELIRRQMEYMMAQINTLADFSEKILPEILEGLPGMEDLKKKIAAIRGKTGSQITISSTDWEVKRANLTMGQRLEDVESKLASHSSKLRRQDALFCDKYDSVLNRLRDVEQSISVLKLKFNMDETNSEDDNLFDPQNIKMLLEKTSAMCDQISRLFDDTGEIKIEMSKRQTEFEGLVEEIDNIESTKIDRFEIDDILADKADCSEVQCKVSTEIFEEFCNSLTKGVDFAIKSTVEQDKQWQKKLEKMLEELERKFNIDDVAPLKEELEKKIEEVNARLDQVARMKTYTMTSASKKLLYTDVNCIACDKRAAMEVNEKPSDATAVKPYLNAKPYINVEMDQLKKMRLKNPEGKNLKLHEQIMKNYAIAVGFDLLPEHDVSFVNRYCGGVETLTNPAQRVARVPKNVPRCSKASK